MVFPLNILRGFHRVSVFEIRTILLQNFSVDSQETIKPCHTKSNLVGFLTTYIQTEIYRDRSEIS